MRFNLVVAFLKYFGIVHFAAVAGGSTAGSTYEKEMDKISNDVALLEPALLFFSSLLGVKHQFDFRMSGRTCG